MFELYCIDSLCVPDSVKDIDLIWTQMPDASWDYCMARIQRWSQCMSKYGVVIASRFDFESEKDLRVDIADDILRFTNPHQLIADPFCGSSNVGEIALELGRRYVGADVSAEAIHKSREKLLAYA